MQSENGSASAWSHRISVMGCEKLPGGEPKGGEPSGGEASGGEPTGGDNSGGELIGGDPMGGEPSGGEPGNASQSRSWDRVTSVSLTACRWAGLASPRTPV